MEFSAVIVAAGSGTRAGPGAAKQWRLLGSKPVLRWSAEALLAAGARQLVVVVRPGDEGLANETLAGLDHWMLARGGATRAHSVRSGLAALDEVGAVLVHDAARPFVRTDHVRRLIDGLSSAQGAIPVLPVTDTLKTDLGGTLRTTPRDNLWRAQTPQAFHLGALREAYAALEIGVEPTDDAQVMELAGGKVVRIEGDASLLKLTYPEDFVMAEALAGTRRQVRVGQGFDAHRFGPGDGVRLCGINIPHDRALIGHSDADAGLHAITDAILGALGEGDIGDHFPPSDPRWRGAPSDHFLRHAAALADKRGGRIAHVDVTLVCEAPKIKPHRDDMRRRLAEILNLSLDQVSVKATTTEKMGFTGRGEGLAAQAVATLELPI